MQQHDTFLSPAAFIAEDLSMNFSAEAIRIRRAWAAFHRSR